MSTISIIIPVYNVEAYLAECLESIINQTYCDLEIILVNDGSTDASPQICEEYAARDARITLIHKVNGGLSDARNAGLKVSTGSYISFVDSDDMVAPGFYSILLREILNNDADIAECCFIKFSSARELQQNENSFAGARIYDTLEALEAIMLGPLSVVVWNKLYRKSVINEILFPLNKLNEDEFWTYKIFCNASKIVKIAAHLYFYRQQNSSIMGSGYSIRRLDGLQAHEERIGFIQEKFPVLENLAIRVYSFVSMYHYRQISLNEDIDPNGVLRNKIWKKVKNYYSKSIIRNLHWKDQLRYQLFIRSPQMYLRINRILEARVQKRINKTAHD